MIPRNFLLFKGIIQKSISKSWKLTSIGNKVFHENNVLRLVKNEYIISNQKNFAENFMKGGLRCTSVLLNNVSTNSIMERIDDKMMPMISKKQEDVTEDDCNKRKGDTFTESEFRKNTESATLRLLPDVTPSKKILRHPDFEIVGHFSNKTGNQTRSLIVFIPKENPNEETRCVVYYYNSRNQKFVCKGCQKCKKTVNAKEINDENGEKIVELSKDDHICEPELYEKVMQILNLDLIEKPNYEIKDDGKNLIVYTDIENTTGYEFYRYSNRKHITTFYCKTCNNDYDTIVSANEVEKDGRIVLRMNNKHVCKPIKFRLDLSEIEQSDLIWPKANQGNREYDELMTKMRSIHPLGICRLEYVTYVIHNAPPGSSVEKIASCILYVGYSEDHIKRFVQHLNSKGIVAELNKKYGELFLIPIFYDIPSACCDLEALIYALYRYGSLNLPLQNYNKCSWKSSEEEGGFRIIAENPDHPGHDDLVLGIQKLIIAAIIDAPVISSRKIKSC